MQLTVLLFRATIIGMSSKLTFAASAGKHEYMVEDVMYAYLHIIRIRQFEHDGALYIKFTGRRHGDPLVPSIEVEMKRLADGRVIVFHVNAEQGTFWDKD